MSLEDGHLSPTEMHQATPTLQPSHSESDLSDVNDLVPSNILPTDAQDEHEAANEGLQDMATSQSDDEEDAAGSEDADYAAESPPSLPSNGSRRDSLSSDTSSQPRKRKVEVDDDQFMQQNPELYGLRRSVRSMLPISRALLTLQQGRARPTRRVVCICLPLLHRSPNLAF